MTSIVHVGARCRALAGLVLITALTNAGCDELLDEATESCGPPGNTNVFLVTTAAQALTSPFLQMGFVNGTRVFGWYVTVDNVCTANHVKAHWGIAVERANLPPGWSVDAGWATSAVHGGDVTLTSTDLATGRVYTGDDEIGLKQVYKNGPGRFVLGLTLSFTSQGNETTDREALQRVIGTAGFLRMEAEYKAFKL